MGSSGLVGPFQLCAEGIDVAVRKASPGVFALGCIDREGRFILNRVGRTDSDLRGALRNFIGSDALFKFTYLHDPRVAFEKECELFHKFHPNGNFLHPHSPPGSGWTCPYCMRGF